LFDWVNLFTLVEKSHTRYDTTSRVYNWEKYLTLEVGSRSVKPSASGCLVSGMWG